MSVTLKCSFKEMHEIKLPRELIMKRSSVQSTVSVCRCKIASKLKLSLNNLKLKKNAMEDNLNAIVMSNKNAIIMRRLFSLYFPKQTENVLVLAILN